MKKRNCRVEVRFTKDELYDLTKKARKAHLTNSAFIRRAISEKEVKEAPSVDFNTLSREVRRVGSNIEQLLKVANTKGFLDAPRLRKALDEYHQVNKMINEAFQAPED